MENCTPTRWEKNMPITYIQHAKMKKKYVTGEKIKKDRNIEK